MCVFACFQNKLSISQEKKMPLFPHRFETNSGRTHVCFPRLPLLSHSCLRKLYRLLVVHSRCFSKLHLWELLKAFKVTVFSHGWKINGVFHEKENTPRFQETLEAAAKTYTLHAPLILPIWLQSLLIALFSYSRPRDYTALRKRWINHSGNVEACGFSSGCIIVRSKQGTCKIRIVSDFMKMPCKSRKQRCTLTPIICSCPPHYLPFLWCVS